MSVLPNNVVDEPQNVGATSTKEYSLRVPKFSDVKYQMMKFNGNLNTDFGKWSDAKMERDVDKIIKTKAAEKYFLKYGAGSEFGREAKQKSRKRKYGDNEKVSESSPWNLKVGGKKFRGVREGGITDNSAYYLFFPEENGVMNAIKLEEWYNFLPLQPYKTLTAEEAEEEFGRRNKVLNHFALMIQKRLKNKKEEEIDVLEKKKVNSCKSKELKISEMDDDDDTSNSTEEEEEKEEDKGTFKIKQKQKMKVKAKPKRKAKGSDESAFEESDDGDEEGRELDYISDSSEDVSDDEAKVTRELQCVSEEKGLKSLLTSDEEDDEDEEEKKVENKDEKNNTNVKEADMTKKQFSQNKKNEKNTNEKSKYKNSNSNCSSVNTYADTHNEPTRKRPFSLDEMKSNCGDPIGSSNNSSDLKYLSATGYLLEPAQKKLKRELLPVTICDTHGITEEDIRRYLSRKPMTTLQIASKFKKRSNFCSDQLINIIALLLKKINPKKKIVSGKMYLSLED